MSFCEICQECLNRPDVRIPSEAPAFYDVADARISASGGCQLCQLFLAHLKVDPSIGDDDPRLKDLVMTLATGGHPAFPTISDATNSPSGPHGWTISVFGSNGLGPEIMVLRLQPRTDIGQQPAVQGQRDSRPVPIRMRPLPPSSTGDNERLALAIEWIETCQKNHVSCQRLVSSRSDTRAFPTRLIDISEPSRPRIVYKNDLTRRGIQYVTVSHRWRSSGMPELLRKNVGQYEKHIDVSYLPLVFRDAIEMCRRIGHSYLWVEALCLVQDDETERTREIEVMGDIYSSAFCSFSALAATDNDVGLFVELVTDYKYALPLTVERCGPRFALYAHSASVRSQLNN